MAVVIRKATERDAAILSRVASELFEQTYGESIPSDQMASHIAGDFSEDKQLREIRDPAIESFLVEHEGQPVGFAQLRWKESPIESSPRAEMELWRIYLDRSLHGGGAAPRLLEHLGEEARAQGATEMWLAVWESNGRAIAFYQKHGFVVVGQQDFHVGGEVQTDLVLQRRLVPIADADLAARTQEVYERRAAQFDAERSKSLHERKWLDRFLDLMKPKGRVLDLGCGSGDPIAGYFMSRGFPVVGVDASQEMVTLATGRYPGGDWRVGDMRRLDLPEVFDGIVAWNSFFHLMPAEQRDVIERLGRHLRPGGTLMLTVGHEAGEVAGRVGGETVYHASLAPDEYEDLLARQGVEVIEFVREDPQCHGQTVILGRKPTGTAPRRAAE